MRSQFETNKLTVKVTWKGRTCSSEGGQHNMMNACSVLIQFNSLWQMLPLCSFCFCFVKGALDRQSLFWESNTYRIIQKERLKWIKLKEWYENHFHTTRLCFDFGTGGDAHFSKSHPPPTTTAWSYFCKTASCSSYCPAAKAQRKENRGDKNIDMLVECLSSQKVKPSKQQQVFCGLTWLRQKTSETTWYI